MNIEIVKTKKNAALLRAMVSDNAVEAYAARIAFAAYITEPVQQIIAAAPVLQQFFANYTHEDGTPATVPMANLFDIRDAGFFPVWVQSRAGGLARSTNIDSSEIPVNTYERQGAISLKRSFLRAARTDVLGDYLEHLAQNFLVRSELDRAAVLADMAAKTTYKLKGADTRQVYRTLTQGTVLPQDLNAVNRIMARVYTANIGGTSAGASRTLTHVAGSPEFVEEIRNWAWEALNNRNTGGALGAPERMRDGMYDDAGDPSILGAKLVTLNSLGQNEAYNILFAEAAGATTYAGYNNGAAVVFSPGSEECVYCIDKRVKGLVTLTTTDPDTGAGLKVLPDDQFSSRSEEIGFFMKKREGHAGVSGRGLVTMVF